MSCPCSCPHISSLLDIPIQEVLSLNQKFRCRDCNCTGPNLWMCLHNGCWRIGCSEEFNDHNTLHNAANPSHCIHMNLSTHRIWCYKCKSEVFMEPIKQQHYCESEPKECTLTTDDISRAKCAGSVPCNVNGSGTLGSSGTIGLNVGMGGDTSESSDTEDASIVNSRPLGLVGLQNIGNTCYLNAALQALSNTVPLTKFFLDCPATVLIVSEGRKPGLSRTYQLLMTEMWLKKNGGYVIPSGILYGIRNVHAMFRGYHQHDTQEFLRNFMDQLHEELKQIWTPDPAWTDLDSYSTANEEPAGLATAHSSNYDSSEGEYETCDSGVSERSSLSDDMERIPPSSSGNSTGNSTNGNANANTSKRRLSRSASPSRRLRTRFQNTVIENQPTTSAHKSNNTNSSGCVNDKSKLTKYKSIISDIFDGKLLSTVQCLTCNRVSSRVETFQDLSLPIPSRDHLAVLHGRSSAAAAAASGGQQYASSNGSSGAANTSSAAVVGSTCTEAVLPTDNGWIAWILVWIKSWFYGPTITLHDCLAAFFSTDELKGDNMYSCERCNKLRNGIKYSKVLQLPEVLCIHLKRFRHELMFSSKISSTVSFPLKGLDMRPYLHPDCVSHVTNYELFAVICHHGTAGGGHYTCYALNSGQWYEFDDQCVTRVNAETVQNCEAYVLFYRKVTADTAAVKTKVMELSREAASSCCEPNDDEIYYISRQWLSRFHTCAEPGPIDNRDFLCQHGYVAPERAKTLDQMAVVVPKSVYNYLYKRYGGNEPTPTMICTHCHAHQRRLDLEMETLMQLNLASQKQQYPATHLLSKSWYGSWLSYVQRKSPDPPGPIDNGKSGYISHLSEDYAEVSEDIWNFFHTIYGGGPELRLSTRPLTDSDSNCETSDCNGSDAPLVVTAACAVLSSPPPPSDHYNYVNGDDNLTNSNNNNNNNNDVAGRIAADHGCHGEPIDVLLEDIGEDDDNNDCDNDGTSKIMDEMFADEDADDDTIIRTSTTNVLQGHRCDEAAKMGRRIANGGSCNCNNLGNSDGGGSGGVGGGGGGGGSGAVFSSNGTSNTSLTDDEIQSDVNAAASGRGITTSTNLRRFYRRRKQRDVYK